MESFLIRPDSQRVVYVADQDEDQVFEVYSVPLGGGTVTKLNDLLVASGDVFAFRIGPGSQQVVYVADQDTTGVDELYSVPLGGGTVTKLNGPARNRRGCHRQFFHQPEQWAGTVPGRPGHE